MTRSSASTHPPLVVAPQPKNFDKPDESVRMPGADEDIIWIDDEVVARIVQYPGWRWSTDMRPIAGTEWCETRHVGYNQSGRQAVRLRDGTVIEYGPGDVYDIPAGHDGWTVGDEPCVQIEWSGARTWAGRNQRFLDRELLTLLMTDVVESTPLVASIGDAAWRELIGRHIGRIRAVLAQYRGTEVDIAGDGLLATFDGPARAIRCAVAIGELAPLDGLHVRAAVNVGEVEVTGSRVRGLAVHEVSRILGLASADEVLVSQTTRDLATVVGFTFDDRGMHQLKGIPEPRHVFALERDASQPRSGSVFR